MEGGGQMGTEKNKKKTKWTCDFPVLPAPCPGCVLWGHSGEQDSQMGMIGTNGTSVLEHLPHVRHKHIFILVAFVYQ